jgi:hypothetical protein
MFADQLVPLVFVISKLSVIKGLFLDQNNFVFEGFIPEPEGVITHVTG